MKIVVHDYSGHPFQVQLSRELAKRDHKILHLYASFLQTPRGRLKKIPSDNHKFEIQGVQLSQPFTKFSYFRRRFQEIEYGHLIKERIKNYNPDVLISSNCPLDPQSIIIRYCKQKRIKFIFWMQDFYGFAISRLLKRKIPILGIPIGHYYIRLERKLLKQSDEIIVVSDDFIPIIEKWKINTDKIHFIPNWAPIEEIPVKNKANKWAKQHGLDKKICILYSGTLALKHNPDLLLKIALYFKNEEDKKIMVVSEGPGADWLIKKKSEFDLKNISIVNFQPFELLPEVLASSDILVAILGPDAGIFSVPSKVLTYMCAKRPIVLAIPPENLAKKIILRNEAGLVSSPGNSYDFIKNVDILINNEKLRSKLSENAYEYAKKMFDIKKICNRFESIFEK